MLKKVRIKIESERFDSEETLFDWPEEAILQRVETPDEEDTAPRAEEEATDHLEFVSEGILKVRQGVVELTYDESELSGMEGSRLVLQFHEGEEGLVSMTRSGTVMTSLVFEENRRHICSYKTPIMPFELCVHTRKVDNRLLSEGHLYLDYSIEIRGAKAERTKLTLTMTLAQAEPIKKNKG